MNNTIRHPSNGDFEVIYHYHNTTKDTGLVLTQYEEQAKTQEQTIMRWMYRNGVSLTPDQALRIIFANTVPITSVRRALTNLTNAGELVKTDKQVKGPYGRKEHLWKLPTGQQRLL